MANRKATVVNPAGYQEQLPDTDNLVLAAAPTEDSHGANKKYVDEATLDPNTGESIYVEVSGDNMTGDLTLGTDKITLGVDGAASFASTVTALQFFGDRPNASNFVYGTGLNGERTSAWLADSTLKIGTNSSGGNEKITLNANGSASFASTVSIPSAADTALRIGAAGVGYGAYWEKDGEVKIGTNLGGGAEAVNINLLPTGSASFASTVETTGKFESNRTVATHTVLRGLLNDTETSLIQANGTATFAGALEAASIDGGTY